MDFVKSIEENLKSIEKNYISNDGLSELVKDSYIYSKCINFV